MNGFCISQSSCLAYSYYNSLAGGSFSSSNCVCFTGFQLLFPGYCTRCAINCKTCSGTASNQCSSCPTGASGSSCGYNTSYSTPPLVDWTTGMPTINGSAWTINVAAPFSEVQQGSCTSANYVFGYYGYYNEKVYSSALTSPPSSYGQNMFPNGAKLTYTNTGAFTSINHYAMHIRATVLFIDDWSNGMSILFAEGGKNRFQLSFQMEGVPGEYLCGYNTYDHHDIADSTFDHSSADVALSIYSASNGYAWGIKDILIHVIKCDTSCATCNGPTSANCLTCTDSTKTVVSGTCVCDFASGYFLDSSNVCTLDCGSAIQDNFTYKCVSSCGFPNYFIYTDNSGVKSCLVNCPTNYYKKTVSGVKSCVLDCYDTAQTTITLNQFKFNSSDLTCYNVCPNNTFGDPLTHSCVAKCSTLNSSTT